jgi:NLI interacting factor-like phosphatase
MSVLPLVLLLDLDHTIIGDASFQVCRQDVCTQLGIKADPKSLAHDLESGLLRPYFESFIKYIYTKYPNAEVYIYTAAGKKWANIMISTIEKMLNIKFNRPIFSREYCVLDSGTYIKSMSKLSPLIFRRLKTRYKLTHISQLKKQFVLVDNNVTVRDQDAVRFVKCPSFEYFVPCNVVSWVPGKTLRDRLPDVLGILKRYGLFHEAVNVSDPAKFWCLYYANLSEIYKKSLTSEVKNKKDSDKFWLYMERVFRNHTVTSFNSKVVEHIKKNIGS